MNDSHHSDVPTLTESRLQKIKKWGVLIVVVVFLTLLWNTKTLREYHSLQYLQHLSDYLHQLPVPVIVTVVIAYVVASIVLFPVTAVSVLTALALPPSEAVLAAMLGIIFSSCTGYFLGRLLGPERIMYYFGKVYRRVRKVATNNVFISVFVLHHLPIGPFTLVNTILGSMRLNFWKYIFATALSHVPTIVIAVFFSDGVKRLLG